MEYGFHARGDTWIRTINDRNGTVVFFAITSCDKTFHPTFYAPYRAFKVVLNASTFDQAIRWNRLVGLERAFGVNAQYFLSGATGNSRLMEHLYGGNPLDYKSIAYGINDVCPRWHEDNAELGRDLIAAAGGPEYSGDPANRPDLRGFRTRHEVNTYGETAPAVFIDLDRAPFRSGSTAYSCGAFAARRRGASVW